MKPRISCDFKIKAYVWYWELIKIPPATFSFDIKQQTRSLMLHSLQSSSSNSVVKMLKSFKGGRIKGKERKKKAEKKSAWNWNMLEVFIWWIIKFDNSRASSLNFLQQTVANACDEESNIRAAKVMKSDKKSFIIHFAKINFKVSSSVVKARKL